MNLPESQHLVSPDLTFQVTRFDGDGHVINKPDSRNVSKFFLHITPYNLDSVIYARFPARLNGCGKSRRKPSLRG